MTDALLPAQFSDLEPFAATWCLATEARAVRAAHGQPDGRDPGVLRRVLPAGRGSDRVLREVPARRHARRRAALLQLLYSLVMVSFPVEAWRQPHIPDSGAAYLDLLIEPIP